MKTELQKNIIIAKLEAGSLLSAEEELFYLTEILGHTKQEADAILAIAENKDKDLLVD